MINLIAIISAFRNMNKLLKVILLVMKNMTMKIEADRTLQPIKKRNQKRINLVPNSSTKAIPNLHLKKMKTKQKMQFYHFKI